MIPQVAPESSGKTRVNACLREAVGILKWFAINGLAAFAVLLTLLQMSTDPVMRPFALIWAVLAFAFLGISLAVRSVITAGRSVRRNPAAGSLPGPVEQR